MQLSAKQAIVKTISVEIKALTLEKKQVTQSVFKQLDKRELIDFASGTLNGIVWGRVNYHPDKCEKHAEHLHLVWQYENQLLRDTVYIYGERADTLAPAHTLGGYKYRKSYFIL
jgi:hypothetical protein